MVPTNHGKLEILKLCISGKYEISATLAKNFMKYIRLEKFKHSICTLKNCIKATNQKKKKRCVQNLPMPLVKVI